MWGFIASIAAGAVLFLFQRHVSKRPIGGQADPIPPDGPPPPGTLVYPQPASVSPDEVFLAIQAVRPMSNAEAAALIGTFLLSSHNGDEVVSHNPVGIEASKDWTGPYTMVRRPVSIDGQPKHQWRPIRSYPTLKLGVQDWMSIIPSSSMSYAMAGDIDGYASDLHRNGVIGIEPSLYATYIRDALENHWPGSGV